MIAFDNLIGDSDAVDYYVGFDNVTVGRMQAEYLINVLDLDTRTDDDPAYIELCAGDPEDLCARKSFEGFIDAVKPYMAAKKLVILSSQYEYDKCSVQEGGCRSGDEAHGSACLEPAICASSPQT